MDKKLQEWNSGGLCMQDKKYVPLEMAVVRFDCVDIVRASDGANWQDAWGTIPGFGDGAGHSGE